MAIGFNYMPVGSYVPPGPTDSAWYSEAGKQYLRDQGVIDDRLGNTSMVKDSEQDAIEKLAKELGMKLDDKTLDYLVSYYLSERSQDNAQRRSMENVTNYYPELVKGLQKAGLNPFLALQGLGGSAPSSSGISYSGSNYTQRLNKNSDVAKGLISTILSIVAMTVIAAL